LIKQEIIQSVYEKEDCAKMSKEDILQDHYRDTISESKFPKPLRTILTTIITYSYEDSKNETENGK
jgi:hypothetical protein